MITADDLRKQQCSLRQTALNADEIDAHLSTIDGWSLEEGKITKTFTFLDFHVTLSFVNAIADMIHGQDHHPELLVIYNHCTVRYNTHSVNNGRGGLSENDFICAAKIDDIYTHSFG